MSFNIDISNAEDISKIFFFFNLGFVFRNDINVYKAIRESKSESIKMCRINISLAVNPLDFNKVSICYLSYMILLHNIRIKRCTTEYFSVQT